jgi:HK97 family phage prohead protease
VKPETRTVGSTFEIRQAEGQPDRLVGYAAVFDEMSENLGGFREVIAPGAFDNVLKDDVRAFFNHDENLILGRTTAKTLSLALDKRGLQYSIDLPDTQTARDLVVSVQRGDVSQSSFGFNVARRGDDWEEDEETGAVVRTIRKFSRLWDVSPVSIPAYPQTEVALRGLRDFQQARAFEKHRGNHAERARLAALD